MRIEMSNRPVRTIIAALALVAFVALDARADYVTEVLADSPVAYYRLQESNPADGATAIDSSGNANDGTYEYDSGGSGPASMTDTASLIGALSPGKEINIAGTEDGASIDIPGVVAAPTSAFTLEFFIRPEATSYSSGLLALFTTNGGFAFGDVHLNLSNTNLEIAVAGTTGGFPLVNLSSLVAPGEWGHVAVTYEVIGPNAEIHFYVNGMNVGGTFTRGSGQLASLNGASAIGQWGAARDFNGGLDEFAIYDSALSGADVLRHARAAGIPTPAALPAGLAMIGLAAMRRRRR